MITEHEGDWLTAQQAGFNRPEEAADQLRLGRLMDAGSIQLGCRLPSAINHHQQVLSDWIEPLGRRRRRR